MNAWVSEWVSECYLVPASDTCYFMHYVVCPGNTPETHLYEGRRQVCHAPCVTPLRTHSLFVHFRKLGFCRNNCHHFVLCVFSIVFCFSGFFVFFIGCLCNYVAYNSIFFYVSIEYFLKTLKKKVLEISKFNKVERWKWRPCNINSFWVVIYWLICLLIFVLCFLVPWTRQLNHQYQPLKQI